MIQDGYRSFMESLGLLPQRLSFESALYSSDEVESTMSSEVFHMSDGSASGSGSAPVEILHATGADSLGSGSSVTHSPQEMEELIRLRRECLEYKERAEREAEAMAEEGTSLVRLIGKRPNYDGMDAQNYPLANRATMKIMEGLKKWPDGWEKFSSDPHSICQRVMKSGIIVPNTYTDVHYYQSVIAPMVLVKRRSIVGNFQTVCREYIMGENY